MGTSWREQAGENEVKKGELTLHPALQCTEWNFLPCRYFFIVIRINQEHFYYFIYYILLISIKIIIWLGFLSRIQYLYNFTQLALHLGKKKSLKPFFHNFTSRRLFYFKFSIKPSGCQSLSKSSKSILECPSWHPTTNITFEYGNFSFYVTRTMCIDSQTERRTKGPRGLSRENSKSKILITKY